MSAFSQGTLPTFTLSARSIPKNPDTEEITRQLLLQFSAKPQPVISSQRDKTNWGIPRGELPQASGEHPPCFSSGPAPLPQPAPSLSNLHTSRQSTPSHGTRSQPSRKDHWATSRSQTSLRQLAPKVSRPASPRHFSPLGRDPRQQTLGESLSITNDRKNNDTANLTLHSASESSGSSRSIPSVEHNHIRRSGRARAQPANYYAPLRIGSEEPELNTQEAPTTPTAPNEPRPETQPQKPSHTRARQHIRDYLCSRELGGRPIDTEMMSDMKPWKSWKGASGDILALTWSPDGTRFAAGAAAKIDPLNMQYNRRNNLVLGDVKNNRLKEIPDHWIARPNAMNVDDPRLYMSVTDMQWVGDRLYTASFDKTVKIWDASCSNDISCVQSLMHDSQVELTTVSPFDSNILATGTDAITVWDTRDAENPTSTILPIDRPNAKFASTALAWGVTPATKTFLAGGMSEPGDEPNYKGHLGLWRAREDCFEAIKVSSYSQSIHDLKWHSSLPHYVTASPEDPHNARIKGIGTRTKSIVRVFSIEASMRVPCIMEFSCPALDVNQVTFCPSDNRYLTASCTNGATYVWDHRKGDRILHELWHGDPINPIAHDSSREAVDVGVRVALWGSSAGQFYTGASDGVLKRWDIRRSSEDALLQNLQTFQDEIMCASFSPDQSHLLVGDSGGAVHVLSSGPCADPEITEFCFEHASGPLAGQPDAPQETVRSATDNEDHDDTSRSGVNGASYSPSSRPERKRKREEHPDEVDDRDQTPKPLTTLDWLANRSPHWLKKITPPRPDDSLEEEHTRIKTELCESEGCDGEGPAAQEEDASRGKVRRKEKRLRKTLPIIWNLEGVDLTIDSDSESSNCFDLEQLFESLEEDNWFPDSGNIDPNIVAESV